MLLGRRMHRLLALSSSVVVLLSACGPGPVIPSSKNSATCPATYVGVSGTVCSSPGDVCGYTADWYACGAGSSNAHSVICEVGQGEDAGMPRWTSSLCL